MSMYLSGGWYQPGRSGALRTEVIDGAMDAAGVLHRAGVGPQLLTRLALRVRTLLTFLDPQMRGADIDSEQREIIAHRLEEHADSFFELDTFIRDCLDHVQSSADLMGFYLHLVHVTRMLQLLAMAEEGPAGKRTNASKKASSKPRKKATAKASKKASKKTAAKSSRAKAPAKSRPTKSNKSSTRSAQKPATRKKAAKKAAKKSKATTSARRRR